MSIDINDTGIVIHDKEKSTLTLSWFSLVSVFIFFSFKLYRNIVNPTNDFALYSSMIFVMITPFVVYAALLKKDSKSEYDFNEITSIKERMIFGKTIFYLKLRNGKSRNLPKLVDNGIIDNIRKKLIQSWR